MVLAERCWNWGSPNWNTFLSFTGEPYRLIRATLPARKTFFDDLRALTRYMLFANRERSWTS